MFVTVQTRCGYRALSNGIGLFIIHVLPRTRASAQRYVPRPWQAMPPLHCPAYSSGALDPGCAGSLDVQLEIPLRLLAKTNLARGRPEEIATSPIYPSRRRVFITTLCTSRILTLSSSDRAGRSALLDASRGALSRIEVCSKFACHHGADASGRHRRHRRVNVGCSRSQQQRSHGLFHSLMHT